MGLLDDVVRASLDPSYAEAAARPPVARGRADRALRGVGHLVLALGLGVVTMVAVTQLRAPNLSGTDPRDLLEREIADRTAEADQLASDIEVVSAEVAQIQADAVAAVDPALFVQLEEYELASGAVPVTGAGLVVVLDDTAVDPEDEEARVQDVDLQIVTNGLWAAGAEAIAINGRRLTALSAIRSAGPAILVDLDPLVSPYRVEVIGDSRRLQTELARSSAANHLAFLSGTYGIGVTMTAEAELELPGAGNRVLQHAGAPDVASSGDDDGGKGSP